MPNDRHAILSAALSAIHAAKLPEMTVAQSVQTRIAMRQAVINAVTGPGGGWLPIETAPRDGTRVMLWCIAYRGDDTSGVVFSAMWDDGWIVPQHDDKQGGWCDCLLWEPTHWQPLPPGPKETGDEG